MASVCAHVADHVKKVKASSRGCEDCLKMGDTWVHLRMCLECGHVGCCDSSKNRHARAHFHATQHPIILLAERGEDWRLCYLDEVYLLGSAKLDFDGLVARVEPGDPEGAD